MTDLDTRLRALGLPTPTATPVADLRARARRRGRRRTTLAVALVSLGLVGAGLGLRGVADDPDEQVTAGSTTTSSAAPIEAPSTRTIGDVEGVEVTVTPRVDLVDADLVEVTIDGLDRLPGAQLLMCAGDVTAASAIERCDFGATDNPITTASGQVEATERQSVSVSRTIRLHGETVGPQTAAYDCAVESAGCVLAVGPIASPVRAVLVPLVFRATPVPPVVDPVLTLDPPTGIADGQLVTIVAEGLRPNSVYNLTQCRSEGALACDSVDSHAATTDPDGSLTATAPAWATIYDRTEGRVDCAAAACELRLERNGDVAAVPVVFGPEVTAQTPRLRIEPPGPYEHLQKVTITGSGFRPGLDLTARIAQCPAGIDTANEERCGYDDITTPLVVAPDGSFVLPLTLYDSIPLTGSCRGEPGCHLGWVLLHGTTLAVTPIEFAP